MARTPSKPHIPYRGDDPSVGKKTGIKVGRVELRNSGDFEPFNNVLSQADGRTPPRRKKKPNPDVSDGGEENEDEEDDEYGAVDTLVNYTPTPRASTSTRPVVRGTPINFDAVPSPRARKSVGRAQPSRLGARELPEQDEGEDDGGGMDNYDQEDGLSDEDEPGEPVESPSKAAPPPAPTPKGKGRALPPVDEEDEIEDDIARGMEGVEQDTYDDDEEDRAPPKKRARGTPAATTKPKVVRSRVLQKENRDVPEGVRRSQRVPYPPLDYWRGEKIVYAPREPGQKRQSPPPHRRGASKRKRGRARATEEKPEVIEREVIVEVDASNPEAGWDDETDPQAVVLDYHTGGNVTRRVAFTGKMFNPKPAKVNGPDDAWSFEKVFGDGDFMAAGQLVIPARKRKPTKGTKDNTYIFYVVEGAVNVVICETSVVLATGGMFMVPRGNSYFIENIADRDARLFFTQARKMREDEEEDREVSVTMGGRGGSTVSVGQGVNDLSDIINTFYWFQHV
ncbi:CENP-C-C domain-containing protein [Mycena venus]|uniref:CENP-C homolog n=1 Tax=Mycena venus TaxID=2733690 RepID=A0A8H7CJJ5_9AGAR|nr:CENP-C-C domain-containing protein [Mycena venus]